jgi:predicted nucleic acid-binding protein
VIIVDTSTWIDHIRGLKTPMERLLGQGLIALHPFVFGELLLNGLPKTGPFSPTSFAKLEAALLATPAEVAAFISWSRLAGQGVGYVDVHLLVSARMMGGLLLTSDNNLKAQAERFEVAYAA